MSTGIGRGALGFGSGETGAVARKSRAPSREKRGGALSLTAMPLPMPRVAGVTSSWALASPTFQW
ncbi:hypothetical protein BH23ACI1_BH23ACI1_29990 [soil metagenome]